MCVVYVNVTLPLSPFPPPQKHQLVHKALAEELDTEAIHALSIVVSEITFTSQIGTHIF